jgi:hypothetical protein
MIVTGAQTRGAFSGTAPVKYDGASIMFQALVLTHASANVRRLFRRARLICQD